VRVIFDENLSPALARALNALFAGEHEVAHIRDKFGPKVDDADWISALSADDVEIIADRVAGGAMYELPISGKSGS
jgi:hypothetical protein